MINSVEQARNSVGGLFNIAVTPFEADGTVNYGALEDNLNRVIEMGYDGVLVGGQYGEFATMSLAERAELSKRTMQVAGDRVPVLLGAGGSEPAVVKDLVTLAGDLGGIPMVTVPYVSEVQPRHILEYFAQIGPYSKTGILIYNMPETGHIISPDILEQLADNESIVGVKQGDLTPSVVDQIAGRLLGKLRVLGASDLHLFGPLTVGFHGATSTNSSALPELVLNTFRAFVQGDAERARELHMKWYPIRELLRKFGQPQTTKALMNLRGWVGGFVRSPLMDLGEQEKALLAEAFDVLSKDDDSDVFGLAA